MKLSIDFFFNRRIDPRVLQILAIFTYAVLARELSAFERPHHWVLIMLVWGCLLDLGIGKFFFKRMNFPYTPFIASIATSILIDTPHLWMYIVSVTIAILSKAFLTYKGRHVLNPANAGVVFCLLAFPGLVSGIPKLFNLNVYLISIFCIIGVLVATYARVLQIALIWIITFAAFAIYRSWFSGAPISLTFLPMLAPTFFLFSFHMITDPATTPKTLYGRIVFAFLIGLIDTFLRIKFIPFGNFYSLAAVSLVFLSIASLRENPWRVSFALFRKSALVWAVPLFVGLIFYHAFAEDQKYESDPTFKINPSESNIVLFKQMQTELDINFTAIDPKVDKKLANKLRLQWIGPGVTVRDFNKDGWMDILLVNSNSKISKTALFINQSGNGFKDEAKLWGLDKVPTDLIIQAATPFDYNRDGLDDLLLTGPGCTHLLENRGNQYVDVSVEANLRDCGNSIVALPLDYNGDGWLDIYLGRFFSDKIDLKKVNDMFYFGPDSFSRARNGGVGTLYTNKNGKFVASPEVFTPPNGSWTYDLGLADIRNNGKQVLVVANDYGDDFYIETNPTAFKNISREITIPDDRSSMNISFGFWNNQFPQIFLTNVYIPEHKVRGNFLWQYDPDSKSLVDYQEGRKAAKCGWPWGAAFADFNLDGKDDLYVTNGMITRSDKIVNRKRDANFFKMMLTGQVPPDAWRKGSMTVFEHIDDQKDFGAYQRDCLFLRKNENEYENKSLENPDIEFWDGRSVGVIDYDNNGTLDLIITTQGSQYRFLKNQTQPTTNWIGLQLLSDPSITMGAKIKITQGSDIKYHWYQNGKTGFLAYSDPRIHFGLNSGSKKVDVQITWPSQETSVIFDLIPGKYYKLTTTTSGKLEVVK